ncbi:MAG TPA: hypothetical protein VHW44_06365 [Pseudonocardiaceae bacterium]|jgi:hypothetical protein|nr:hypothetical protein [Pseudonocardiaceae bacterium]
MATIRVRDIPDEVVEIFRRRAEVADVSLQIYLRGHLIELARRSTRAEALDHRPSGGASLEDIEAELRELRTD